MKIIAFGELHYLDGRPTVIRAVIERGDGSQFDFPITRDQLTVLVENIVSKGEEVQGANEPAERNAAPTNDAEDDLPPVKLGEVADEEFDEDGDLVEVAPRVAVLRPIHRDGDL